MQQAKRWPGGSCGREVMKARLKKRKNEEQLKIKGMIKGSDRRTDGKVTEAGIMAGLEK